MNFIYKNLLLTLLLLYLHCECRCFIFVSLIDNRNKLFWLFLYQIISLLQYCAEISLLEKFSIFLSNKIRTFPKCLCKLPSHTHILNSILLTCHSIVSHLIFMIDVFHKFSPSLLLALVFCLLWRNHSNCHFLVGVLSPSVLWFIIIFWKTSAIWLEMSCFSWIEAFWMPSIR